jgi:hypothetical protein
MQNVKWESQQGGAAYSARCCGGGAELLGPWSRGAEVLRPRRGATEEEQSLSSLEQRCCGGGGSCTARAAAAVLIVLALLVLLLPCAVLANDVHHLFDKIHQRCNLTNSRKR